MNPDKTVSMFFSFFRFHSRFYFAAKGFRLDCFLSCLIYSAINLDVTGNRASISMDEPGLLSLFVIIQQSLFRKLRPMRPKQFECWGSNTPIGLASLSRSLPQCFLSHCIGCDFSSISFAFGKPFQKTYLLTLSCFAFRFSFYPLSWLHLYYSRPPVICQYFF